MKSKITQYGFTLIELLVVISIVALLVSILLPALQAARKQAHAVTELAASKQLNLGYLAYAMDSNDALLVGDYNPDLPENQGQVWLDDQGNALFSFQLNRYPWRLAGYIDYKIEGTILTNDQIRFARQAAQTWSDPQIGWTYTVSSSPSFGLNYHNLGGDQTLSHRNLEGYLTRLSQAKQPNRLVNFASSAFDGGGDRVSGHFLVTGPTDPVRTWVGDYHINNPVNQIGNIHFRWSDTAVVSHLDGHSTFDQPDELRDMTRWSNAAAIANDPDYDYTNP